MRPAVAGHLTTHPDMAIGVLYGLAQRRRQLGDGQFPDIGDAAARSCGGNLSAERPSKPSMPQRRLLEIRPPSRVR